MKEQENEIRLLEFPQCVREKIGVYLTTSDNADIGYREIIDNSLDESYAYLPCNKIIIEQDFNGLYMCADNGRGLPINLSQDRPGQTQADVSLSTLHSGSKFRSGSTDSTKVGTNGIDKTCSHIK